MRHITDSRRLTIAGMLLILGVAAPLGMLGCSAVPEQPQGEQPAGAVNPEMLRADLVDAHRALLRAYEAADVEAFIALLDPTPQLLIFHPIRQDRWDGIEEVRDNLGAMFAKLGPAFWSEVHTQATLQGEVGWVSYHVVIERREGGEPFVGRGTEVWVLRADGWKLSQGHWSEQPEGS